MDDILQQLPPFRKKGTLYYIVRILWSDSPFFGTEVVVVAMHSPIDTDIDIEWCLLIFDDVVRTDSVNFFVWHVLDGAQPDGINLELRVRSVQNLFDVLQPDDKVGAQGVEVLLVGHSRLQNKGYFK